jgi:hypothetical protein
MFYWWGFKVYIEDAIFQELVRALQQGTSAVQSFLNQQGFGWLGPLVTALVNWGADALRGLESQCGTGALALTVPWNVWNANAGCA